jgi:hypothetical protein
MSALGGIKNAWPVCVGACGVALILCFAYLIFLRYAARLLIYGALITLTLGFGAVGAGLLSTAFNLTGNQDKSPLFQRLSHDDAVLYSEIGAGFCLFFFVVFVILLLCCHELIKKALGCIEAACEVMFGECDLLLQPIIDVIMRLGAFLGLAVGGMYVVSIGEVVADNDATIGGQQVSGVSRSIKYTDEQIGYIVYYIFGYFWIMEVFNALGQFVISYMVVLWYYTPKTEGGNKKMVFCAITKGYAAGVVHLGTLAFGAFLIATLRFVRLFLSFIARQSEASGNTACACVAKCMMCCVDCFKRFLEYINKNAYVDVAINSNNFCQAAIDSFKFLGEQAPTIALLNGACFVFVWAGVACVSGIAGYGGYLTVLSREEYTSNTSELYVNSPEMVGVACGGAGFVISLCFMNVFDQAADTLLYAFAWNQKKDPQGVHFYAPSTLSSITA